MNHLLCLGTVFDLRIREEMSALASRAGVAGAAGSLSQDAAVTNSHLAPACSLKTRERCRS